MKNNLTIIRHIRLQLKRYIEIKNIEKKFQILFHIWINLKKF